MANSTTSHQIPQHVSVLLSHLTSRPGVQSTLILSRKDGSIIQATGLLAPSSPRRTRSETSSLAPASVPIVPAATEETRTDAVTTAAADTKPTSPSSDETTTQSQQHLNTNPSPSSPVLPQQQQQQQQQLAKPYQPTQAESLAAHIFAFVSSASSLSFTLSHPLSDGAGDDTSTASPNGIQGPATPVYGNGTPAGTGADEGDGSEGQDDDEVKLLRLRTKKHEIVVVPDRKYLLCVVQDGTGTAGASGAGSSAGRSSR